MSLLGTTHLIFMVAALLTFAVSFLVGLLYLFQEGRLKKQRPIPPWFQRIPSQEIMDRIHYKVLSVGFLLLSLGMLFGAFLSKKVFGRFFTDDPRQIASLFTWAIYAFFLNVRIRSGWRGRRGILLSLIGFMTVVLIFLGIHHRGL
ncbi:MAG: cytochrome c biogenesis protein CcsA [Deltaproteobacteria bacterium]|nr:cytochrome c biogenesis protein CcsA [Deltaproteobacteria bacterium]